MARLDIITEIKSDHTKVRDILLELIDTISKRDATKALEILLKLDKLTGPHFRWEEESFYPSHIKIFGRQYFEYLLGVHDRIVKRGKDLATILAKGEITEEEAKILPEIIRNDVLPHPIECDGITLLTTKLSKDELEKMAEDLERYRKEGIPLLEWAETIKDKARAERGYKAKVVV
ncbi:MAG: hemerythrin domain-containing protein [Nitrososphaerales archaeon]